MYSHSSVKRTYASRPRQYPSSPRTSSPPSSPSADTVTGGKRKRTLLDCVSINTPPPKRINLSGAVTLTSKSKSNSENKVLFKSTSRSLKSTATATKKQATKPLTQLHFIVDSTLRTCPSCSLSYTQGAVDDEALHKKHCARVQRGLEWGKEEEKEAHKAGVRVIEDLVRIKGLVGAIHGRIISVPADVNGKIGAKITSLLETINLALSSPELLSETLKCSKAYLFLIPSPAGPRERIAGCVIGQRITSAMNIVSTPVDEDRQNNLVHVDGGLYCSPQLHATPLGIPRLFVPSTHRRQGIAKLLLSAAAKTFVHGCELDPTKGQVAFSQPTGDGRKVMENWGKGGVRIYQE